MPAYFKPPKFSEIPKWARTSFEALQTQLKSALDPLVVSMFNIESQWSLYTPTWSAAVGAPVLGDGVIGGAYKLVGQTLYANITLVWGATTSAAGTSDWEFTLPNSLEPVDEGVGLGRCVETGVGGNFTPVILTAGSNVVRPRTNGYAAITPTTPFTFGTGDYVIITIPGIEVQ